MARSAVPDAAASGPPQRVANAHALTARAVCAARADETARPDSLFRDPLAHVLAGQEGRENGSACFPPATNKV